jgi:hypothetical protein
MEATNAKSTNHWTLRIVAAQSPIARARAITWLAFSGAPRSKTPTNPVAVNSRAKVIMPNAANPYVEANAPVTQMPKTLIAK